MKKLLYLLLVVPFLFLLISCDKKTKSQEEKDFEKAINYYDVLDQDYLSNNAMVIEEETVSVTSGVTNTTIIRGEMYKNSFVFTMTSMSDSYSSTTEMFAYLDFKDDDIILYQLTDDESEAKENSKIYQYGEKILYEKDLEGDSLNETLEEISDMSYLKYSDFEKKDNKYSLKKSPTNYKIMGADVSITKYDIEVDDNNYVLNYQLAETLKMEFSGITTYSSVTSNATVNRNARPDKYIQEVVKAVK